MLLGTIILQSCDMGKYYFRMHPGRESHQPKHAVQQESVSNSLVISEEKVLVGTHTNTIIEQAETRDPIPIRSDAITEQVVPTQESAATIQYEPTNESSETISTVKVENKHRKASSHVSNGEKIGIGIFLAILLVILVGCILLFLILWIFVPALLAFKIALCVFGIAALFPVIAIISIAWS